MRTKRKWKFCSKVELVVLWFVCLPKPLFVEIVKREHFLQLSSYIYLPKKKKKKLRKLTKFYKVNSLHVTIVDRVIYLVFFLLVFYNERQLFIWYLVSGILYLILY